MEKSEVFQVLMGIPTGVNLFLTEDGKKALVELVDVRLINSNQKGGRRIEKIG